MTSISTTSISTVPVAQSMLLRRTLLGNAIFSTLSALVFLLDARPVAAFLGLTSPIPLIVLGVGLLIFAAAIFKITRGATITPAAAITIIIADIAWVVGSALVLLLGWPPLTVAGKWAVAIVADIVAVFAVLEYLGLRQLRFTNFIHGS